jgi:hypothetical protein
VIASLITTLFGGFINYKHINNPFIDALNMSLVDDSAASASRDEHPVAQDFMHTLRVKSINPPYTEGQYEETIRTSF